MDDIRYALRAAARSPIASIVIVLSLALGIGANTAVFSFVDAVQFKPLPFADEDSLVDVHEWSATELCSGCAVGASYPAYQEWAPRATSFSALNAYVENRVVVSGDAEPERTGSALVSPGLFPMLGITPALGRGLTAQDDAPGAAPVALISDRLWRRRFAANPNVLQRVVRVNGIGRVVVGVMPAGFRFPEFADLWLPLGPEATEWKRSDRSLAVVGRLRSGATIEQARAEMQAIARAAEQAYPETNARWTADVSTLRADMTGETAMASIVLMCAVAFVLLIACANVSNLLLVRASERRREMALRLALGATRGRVLRLVVTESLLLAAAGGAGGVLIALWAAGAIVAALGTEAPYWIRFGIDTRVLLFAGAASTLTGILCGVLPALHLAGRSSPASAKGGRELHAALKDGVQGSGGKGGRRVLHALVVSQLGLSLVLLAGAGLLLKSVAKTFAFDPGYDAARVVIGDVSLTGQRYAASGQDRLFVDAVIDEITRIPGTRAAAFRMVFFAGLGGTRRTMEVEGTPDVPAGASPSFFAAVTPGYFETYGVPIVAGRALAAGEREGAIVNQTLADRLWPGASPLGRRIRFGDQTPWLTVVGVVRNFGGGPLGGGESPFAYLPFELSQGHDITIAAATSGDAGALMTEVRAAVRRADPDQALEDLQTAAQMYASWASPARSIGLLMSALAAVALGLAAIGTYAVFAFSVSRRTRELGIRMALGASSRQVARMISRSALRLGAFALLVGLPGAWATTRALEGVLFGTSPTDPTVFGAAAAVLLCVAFLASWHPARRAARVDPIVALRAD